MGGMTREKKTASRKLNNQARNRKEGTKETSNGGCELAYIFTWERNLAEFPQNRV